MVAKLRPAGLSRTRRPRRPRRHPCGAGLSQTRRANYASQSAGLRACFASASGSGSGRPSRVRSGNAGREHGRLLTQERTSPPRARPLARRRPAPPGREVVLDRQSTTASSAGPRAKGLVRSPCRDTIGFRPNRSRGRSRRDDCSGPEVGGRCRRESNSAVDAARLERLGFCIAGLKQPCASGGETTEAVAKDTSAPAASECWVVATLRSRGPVGCRRVPSWKSACPVAALVTIPLGERRGAASR